MSSVFLGDKWNINYGDLVFKDKIGKGQYGDVYKADYFGTEVCVKKIKCQYKDDKVQSKWVEREVEVLKLNHPNLIQLLGVTEREDGLYIVTEYVGGGDLHTLLVSKYVEMDWSLRVKMAYDVAAAMAYLHSKNIIHRDIKSKNVLIGENWTVKLCDFGYARRVTPLRKQMNLTLCGTDQYMAPEIIFGVGYNQKADIFSYGMLLCEIITRVNISTELVRDPVEQFELDVEKFKILTPRNAPPNFANLAVRCAAYNAEERPSFVEILKELRVIIDQLAEKARHRKSVTIRDKTYVPYGDSMPLYVSPPSSPSPRSPTSSSTASPRSPPLSPLAQPSLHSPPSPSSPFALSIPPLTTTTTSATTATATTTTSSSSTQTTPRRVMQRVKSERVINRLRREGSNRRILKGSRSVDSLAELLCESKYDDIVNGRDSDSDGEDRREMRKRIGVSVGKKLMREVLDKYMLQPFNEKDCVIQM